jgi:hypothetical protein
MSFQALKKYFNLVKVYNYLIYNLKKWLNFNSNFKSSIDYNLSTPTPFTLIKITCNKNLLLDIKCIKLVTSDELTKTLQKEEF